MTGSEELLRKLIDAGVDFIVIGGAAALAHGSARVTFDLDIFYQRSAANLDRLVAALGPVQPYLRGAPPGLPFHFDRETLKRGLNFTLTTNLGYLDLLAQIPGSGSYKHLRKDAVALSIFGLRVLCLNLTALIRVKRAAGRPKDFEALAELEAIREETASG